MTMRKILTTLAALALLGLDVAADHSEGVVPVESPSAGASCVGAV